MNIFKYYVRKTLGLPVHYYFKAAEVPASSHLPVLMTIGKIFPIKSVLEFGSGSFSTLMFLNRAIFPQLEKVISFETDPEWKQRVIDGAGGDKRLEILLVDDDVAKAASKCNFSLFDLVFIDNGPSADARAATIREVAKRCHDSNLIVIHDFENLPYQQAARELPQRFFFDSHCPYTGFLWRNGRIDRVTRSKLKRMKKQIGRHAGQIEPNEVETWTGIIEQAARAL